MKYFIKTENLASRVIEGQAFIINTKTSTLHELDETGTFIWNLIEKKKNRLEILRELTTHFDVTDIVAERDLGEFLSELKKMGLIDIQ